VELGVSVGSAGAVASSAGPSSPLHAARASANASAKNDINSNFLSFNVLSFAFFLILVRLSAGKSHHGNGRKGMRYHATMAGSQSPGILPQNCPTGNGTRHLV
jgi:hypothetical protein